MRAAGLVVGVLVGVVLAVAVAAVLVDAWAGEMDPWEAP